MRLTQDLKLNLISGRSRNCLGEIASKQLKSIHLGDCNFYGALLFGVCQLRSGFQWYDWSARESFLVYPFFQRFLVLRRNETEIPLFQIMTMTTVLLSLPTKILKLSRYRNQSKILSIETKQDVVSETS